MEKQSKDKQNSVADATRPISDPGCDRINRKIPEKRMLEDALRKSEAELNEAQRVAHIGSWDWDSTTDRIWWSDEYYRIYNLDPKLPTPSYLEHLKLYTPESSARLNAAVEKAMQTGETYELDLELARPTATTRWICARGEAKRDANGRITGLRGTAQDITERKRTEMKLRQNELFIKNVLETVDEGFIIVDPDYNIMSANRAYLERLKMPLEEVVGKHCYSLTHHIDRPCYEVGERCAVQETFKTGKPSYALHTHYDTAGDTVYVEIKSYPVVDASGMIISAIETITDITAKKRLEEQLRHAQKMEAIGTLAGGIAHDFNNILSAIIGYGSLVQMKVNPDDPLRINVDHILDAANRAAQLTQGLLTFSRKQVITVQPIRLNDVIVRVEKLLTRIIGEDVNLAVKLPESELNVMADSSQIEQVLMNLATNARDAMPQGGLLQVDVEVAEIDGEYIRVHGYGKAGHYALISVTDTGSGMDQQTLEKIFEPFFTTKDVGKGTGLGLAIVYGIIKQHNGYINVYSEPGKGSTFKIYLPLIRDEVENIPLPEPEHMLGGTETLLIAEDDDTLRDLICTILREFGYKIIEARDGEEAVRKFKQSRDAVRLVILDVIMPGMNGKDAYDAIAKIQPRVKIIFQSGYPVDLMHRKGLPESADHFLSKPISPRLLLKKVRQALDS
jgi:PAS domain S-box-containing protein